MAAKSSRENFPRVPDVIGVGLGFAGALGVHVASRVVAEISPSYAEVTGHLAERIGVRPELGADVGALVAVLVGVGVVLGVALINKLIGVGENWNAKVEQSANKPDGDDYLDEYEVPSWASAQKSPWGF